MGYKIPWQTAVLMSIFPPIQLIMRIFYMKGSLDRPWLLLFMFPLLSVVPAVMMALGMVEDGKGGTPYDNYMMIPPALYGLGLLLSMVGKKKKSTGLLILSLMMQIILPMLGGMLAFYLRDKSGCSSGGPTLFSTLLNTLSAQGIAFILSKGLYKLPVIGPAMETIRTKTGIVGDLIDWSVYTGSYFTSYTIINMVNGKDYEAYCKSDISTTEKQFWHTIRTILGIGGGVGLIIGAYIMYTVDIKK